MVSRCKGGDSVEISTYCESARQADISSAIIVVASMVAESFKSVPTQLSTEESYNNSLPPLAHLGASQWLVAVLRRLSYNC